MPILTRKSVAPKEANDHPPSIKPIPGWRPNNMPEWHPIKVPKSLRAYLAACRFRGAPASMPRLLQALADEHFLGQAVAQAEADGGTQLRLVDDAGHTQALRPITPAPRGLNEVLELGRTLSRDPGQQWQIWTGTSWFTVPGALTRPDHTPDRNR
jgi:hypothetical protein